MIELLAVVGIIAVLAGVSAAVYGSVRARAQAVECAGKLRQLGTGLNLYQADHDGMLPIMEAGRKSLEEDVEVMDKVLAEYVDGPDVFRCPSDHGGLVSETGSSYFWNSVLNGQRAGSLRFFGADGNAVVIPVFTDKEDFHEGVGKGVNVLYADGHVESKVKFRTGE